jgi:CRP-like cAMP-binding protein
METRALICKLEQFARLSDDDKARLEGLARTVRDFGRHLDVIREGTRPDDVHLVVQGWAARTKTLRNGSHSIMAYLIPGDLCDLQVSLLSVMDHSIRTLSPCRIAFIPREAISDLLLRSETLGRALWWSTLLDEAILREWIVMLGHRPADQRVAHLLCEMLLRSRAVGLTQDDSFELPLTQEELGESMGLSTVHINRTLQDLRGQGLISTEGKRVIAHDLARLMEFSDFDPTYLHQVNRRARTPRPARHGGTAPRPGGVTWPS